MRERFSTGIYCDYCGKGKDEVTRMIAAPAPANSHICGGCVIMFAGDATDIARLATQALQVQMSLDALCNAVSVAKKTNAAGAVSDLFFASHHAWRELDAVIKGPIAAAMRKNDDGK